MNPAGAPGRLMIIVDEDRQFAGNAGR